MTITMLKAKIHRVTVTQAEPDYIGSVTIDEDLMEAAGILEYERVQVVDIDNGSRIETYAITGERGSGIICLNGAAARLFEVGDKVILMTYADMSPDEAVQHQPRIVFVDEKNRVDRIKVCEQSGTRYDASE